VGSESMGNHSRRMEMGGRWHPQSPTPSRSYKPVGGAQRAISGTGKIA
jgi:hypothetical protein